MAHTARICRKLAAAILVIGLLAGLAVPAGAAGAFGDVSGSDWYYDAVNFVANKGLFQGTSATAFSPNAAMTRGMFITVLGRYANVDAAAWNTGAYHAFSDVSADKYYAGYAVWAFEKGVVTGDGSASTFNPSGNITRQEVCTMLNRFATVMGIALGQSAGAATFPDDGNISGWARDSVYAMQRGGVVKGDEKGAFNPRNPVSRAETAAMIQRFDSACGGYSSGVQQPSGTTPGPETPGSGEPWQPTPGTLLANAALVSHLDQGDRYCCLATSFSMAVNMIMGRDEYGAFDWTGSDTDDSLSVPSGTTFQGTDGHAYTYTFNSTDLEGLRSVIDSSLSRGVPIIASVQSVSTAGTHYVLFIGWTDTAHSDYLISDPAGGGYIILDDAEPMSESYSLGNRDGSFVYLSFS